METQQPELQPALGLVKAEALDAQQSAASSGTGSSSRPTGNGGVGLFAGIANSNKRPRTDDWLAPESPKGPLPQQHLYISAPQQHTQQVVHQPQPPMAHSTPITQNQQQQQQQSVIGSQPPSNNGYASPMSSGSYDPYSPNGKIGKLSCNYLQIKEGDVDLSLSICVELARLKRCLISLDNEPCVHRVESSGNSPAERCAPIAEHKQRLQCCGVYSFLAQPKRAKAKREI